MPDVLRVHGTLTDEIGRELSYAEVRLWRRRLRERELLAEADSSEEGTYEIVAEWPEAGPGKVLVTVEATSNRLPEPLESGLIEARAQLEVDLQQPPSDPSEYGVLRRAIELQLERLPITEVVESDEYKDISFLSREIGRGREEIVRVLIAARLSANYDIPAAAFYAFLRQHVPAALPTPLLDATDGFQLIDPLVQRVASLIFALSPDTQTQTLQSAVANNLIEPQLEKS